MGYPSIVFSAESFVGVEATRKVSTRVLSRMIGATQLLGAHADPISELSSTKGMYKCLIVGPPRSDRRTDRAFLLLQVIAAINALAPIILRRLPAQQIAILTNRGERPAVRAELDGARHADVAVQAGSDSATDAVPEFHG